MSRQASQIKFSNVGKDAGIDIGLDVDLDIDIDANANRDSNGYSAQADSIYQPSSLMDINPEVDFGYYSELGESRCLNDFKQRIDIAVNRLGFQDYIFVDLESNGHDEQLINTFDNGLMVRYRDEKLYEYDMTFGYARENLQPIFHSSLQNYIAQSPVTNDLVRGMRAIDHQNKLFGYYDFYNTLASGVRGAGNVMFCVSQRGLNPTELQQKASGCAPALQLLCEAIDFVATKKFSSYFSPEKPAAEQIVITPKPLLVIETLANHDLTIAQVADRLSIGKVTASKHLETVRKALGVKTNHGAIRKAVALGLIEYSKSVV